uniref:GRAM domain-containing protein n=1 Tax=Strongyloides venezuelensis TaxID=75913 RepID=A0A0K0F650_STRVS
MSLKKNSVSLQPNNSFEIIENLASCTKESKNNVKSKLNVSEQCTYDDTYADNIKLQKKILSRSMTYKALGKKNVSKNEDMEYFKSAFKNYCVQETDKIASRLKVKYSLNSQLIFNEWLSIFTSIFVSHIFLRYSKRLVIPIPSFIVSLSLLQLSLMKKKELIDKSLAHEEKSKIKDVDSFLGQVMNINDRKKVDIYYYGINKLTFMMNTCENFAEKIYFFIKKIKDSKTNKAKITTSEDDDNIESKDIDESEISDNIEDDQFVSILLDFSPNNVFEFSKEINSDEMTTIKNLLNPYLTSNDVKLLSKEFKKDTTTSMAVCISYINAIWKNGVSSSAGSHIFKSFGYSKAQDFFYFEGECKTFNGKDIEVVSIPLSIEGTNKQLEFVMIRPLDGIRYGNQLQKIGEICQRVNIELNIADSSKNTILIPIIQFPLMDSLENINFIGEKTLFYSCTKSAAYKDIHDSTSLNGLYYFSSLSITKNGIKSMNNTKDKNKNNKEINENSLKGKKYNIRMDIPFHYAIIDTTSNHTILIGSYFGNYVSNFQRIITKENLKKLNEDKLLRRMKRLKQEQKKKVKVCCG